MSEHQSPSTKTSDEIDLGQLFQIIKNGFKSLGNVALHIFLFLKKNLLILLGLILLGVGINYGLNQVVSEKLKTEVIVRPNFESTDYLEDVVEELKINFITKNETFLKSLGIALEDSKGFEIDLEPILDEELESDQKIMNQLRYLETLNNFKDQGFAMDILKSELAEKSVINYKLTLQYNDAQKGPEIADKIIEYINTNEYFNQIKEVYFNNAKSRIANNSNLIKQIDDVVANYSNSLRPNSGLLSNKLVYADKEPLNVESLLDLKARLLKDIEEKNVELKQQSSVISILNYGSTQPVSKTFFEGRLFKIPLVLVLGFLAYCFIKYLNKKSKEIA